MDYQPTAELAGLVEAACNGELTPQDCARLETLLHADPDARRFYMRYMSLDADLWLEADAGQDDETVPASGTVPRPATAGFLRRSLDAVRNRRRLAWIAGGVAAATVAAAILVAVSPMLREFRPDERNDRPGPPRELAAARPSVADITRSAQAQWSDDADLGTGATLSAGRKLSLAQGLAEITFRCGARVILQGPATLELESSQSGHLHAGKLVATVPKEAVGFTLHTAKTTVVDLGTEFGVRVDDRGDAEVHVFRGEVDVEPAVSDPAEGSAQRESLRLTQGQAVRVGGEAVAEVAADATHFTRNDKLTALTETVAIKETFSGDKLDPATWKTVLPTEDAAVRLKKGCAELVSRGYLVTTRQYDPLRLGGIRITGKWRFASAEGTREKKPVDVMSILTRCNAQVGSRYYEADGGISFRLISNELLPRIRAHGKQLAVTKTAVQGKLDAAFGDLLEFEIVDDGRDLSFLVRKAGDAKNAVRATATVVSDTSESKHVVFYNREKYHRSDPSRISCLSDVLLTTGVGPCSVPVADPGKPPTQP